MLKVQELRLQSGAVLAVTHHSILETKYEQKLKFLVCFPIFRISDDFCSSIRRRAHLHVVTGETCTNCFSFGLLFELKKFVVLRNKTKDKMYGIVLIFGTDESFYNCLKNLICFIE